MSTAVTQRIWYIAADFIAGSTAWLLFNIMRYLTLPGAYTTHRTMSDFMCSPQVLMGQIIVPVLLTALYALSGYYNRPFFKSRVDEFVNTLMCTFAAMLGIFFGALLNDNIPERLRAYEIMAILWGLLFLVTFTARSIITYSVRRRVSSGRISFPTAIVGEPNEATSFAAMLQRRPARGMKAVCIITPPNTSCTGCNKAKSLPVYTFDKAETACMQHGIRNIVLTPAGSSPGASDRQMAVISALYHLDRPIFITPEFQQLLTLPPRLTDVANDPLLTDVSGANISPLTTNLKRVGDIVVSTIATVLLLPLYVVIAAAIKTESPRQPVFYRQQRIGYHKKTFNIIKFRTMRPDAEADGPALSSTDDPRVTRVGKVLRRYRLDELPQFVNVLRGDMSLVGPRPERAYYIEQILRRVPCYSLVHSLRPGITSWGMVKYGYAEDVDQMVERLRYDLIYMGNVSFAVDMKILLNTVSTVLAGRGK